MKRISCLALAAWLCGTAWAQAPAAPKEAFCSRPLRVALMEHGVLYRRATNDGIDARLMDLLAQRTGCSLERVVLPRARTWKELQAGNVDIVTGAAVNAERKSWGYMLPYLKARNVLLIRKGVAVMPQSLAQFEDSGLRVGVVRGAWHEPAYSEWLERLRHKGRVVEAVDVPDVMRFFEKGLVDATLGQPMVYSMYLDAAWLDKDAVLMDWAPRDEGVIATLLLARKSFTPEQARHWDQVLAGLLKDGTVHKIAREFLSAAGARDLAYNGPRDLD